MNAPTSSSSSADRMRGALARRPTPGTETTTTGVVVEAPRVKPVRATLDLPPTEHRDTKRLVLDLEAPSLVALVRALLILARTEPDIADRVRAQLRKMRAEQ